MLRFLRVSVALLLWSSVCSLAVAEERKQVAKADPDIERVACRVRVVANGIPVQGAKVRPYGFRTRVERGSHYGWAEQRHGKQPTVETDADGIALVEVPKYVYEKLEIGEVSWMVDHNNFVVASEDHGIDEAPVEIVLEPGYRIAATAVDAESGEAVTKDLYAVLSGYRRSIGQEWRLTKSGMLLSRVFGHERSVVRLIHLPEDGPARFSKLVVAAKPNVGSRVLLKDVKLEAGTRVEGKLADAVPRPVKHGRVVAYISASIKRIEQDRQQLWSWSDVAEVKEGGSFTFESLPRGDVVQLIAVCDGWLSKSPTQTELDAVAAWARRRVSPSFRIPQVFELDAERVVLTLKMEKSATCEVEVLRPDGKPLKDARVYMWPNHIWLRGGSTILASGFSTADWLSGRFEQSEFFKRMRDAQANRFADKTNDQGIAVIRNLPQATSVGLSASHEEFLHPIVNGRRSTNVSLVSGETKQVVLQMQEVGAEVLGE